MDQINIVSSQAVLEMSSFSMDKWCALDVFLASSKTDCSRPYETSMSRRFNSSTLWICHVIDTMLHDSPYLVIHRTEIWAVWRPQVGRKKVWCFLTHAVQLARARRGVPVHCPAGTKSLPDNLLIAGSSMTSLWRREAVSKKSVRYITRISCFVITMKLPHALQIYSTVFVKTCMRLLLSR